MKRIRFTGLWSRAVNEQGSAAVELALTLGIFGVPILLGTMTLANVVYSSIEVANAAHAGALYGMISATYAADTAGIQSAAQQEASDIGSNLKAVPVVYFACSAAITGTQYTSQSSATSACSGSGNHALEFVQVTASATITPVAHFPKLPSTFTLSTKSVMEVLE